MIETFGDRGPGENEPDRVDLGFLPGDVDQNGTGQPADLLRFRQIASGVWTPDQGTIEDLVDIDRDGDFNPLDLLRYRQLVLGGVFQPGWAGESMNAPQP